MSNRVVPGLSELVYSLICEHPGIFKHDLLRMVHESLNTRTPESDLSDVISCLKLHRGGVLSADMDISGMNIRLMNTVSD